ncbi:CcdC protein domain-containing protein [Novosphingobium sp. 9]|uniref:CcdC protein domain-containing protein n=1 Tax=Novosphingobium sp. 9 TaxID=2025349 RepID=UPI0021B65E72|nr:CcdC protein domain-containing protein [Novosphingobium sp. 9]
MTGDAKSLLGYLPVAIFALVMLLRYRNLQKARPLRLPMLWIMPVILCAVVGIALFGMHPSPMGWLAVAGGVVIGAAIGWQRGRMMRLHVEGEGENARVMMRQSPAALLFVAAIFIVRRVIFPSYQPGSTPDHHPAAGALLVTDGMLGLALGMVLALRLCLWLRARKVAEEHRLRKTEEVFQ